MGPGLGLEHLKHGDLIRAQGIAFDLLQTHRTKAACAGSVNVRWGGANTLAHACIIAENPSKSEQTSLENPPYQVQFGLICSRRRQLAGGVMALEMPWSART